MKSTQQKLITIFGLIDTKDVSDWENKFLKSTKAKYENQHPAAIPLSDKQLEVVERIYDKHFA